MNSTQTATAIRIECYPGIGAYHFGYMKPAYFVSLAASCAVNAASAVFGAVANVLVIAAIKRNPSLHSNAYYVLVVLAVSDLLSSCLTVPIFVAVNVEVLVDRVSCATAAAFTAFRGVTTMASLFATLGVSMERVLAVTASYWYVERATPFRLVAPPVCAWATFIAFDAARFFGFSRPVIGGLRSLLILICVAVTVVAYGILVKAARRHRREIAAQEWSAQTEDARKKKIRDNKSLIVAMYVTGASLLSYVPLSVGLMSMVLGSPDPAVHFTVTTWMGTALFLGGCVNPYVYCWRSSSIRKAIVQLLKPGQIDAIRNGRNIAGTSDEQPPTLP